MHPRMVSAIATASFSLLVACGGGSSTSSGGTTTNVVTETSPKPVVMANPVCPEQLWQIPWNRELFPGCPPEPFYWVGVTCDGTRCPMPCRDVSTDRARVGPIASQHRYEEGRWISSERAWSVGKGRGEYVSHEDPPPGGRYCTRTGDRATCDVMRRGDHEDARVTLAEIQYNEFGDPISLMMRGGDGPTTYEWAAGHQLVRERVPRGNASNEFRYSYDGHGRVTRVEKSGWGETSDTRYHYDAIGHVTKVVTDYANSRQTFSYEYDAQHRPVRSEWLSEIRTLEPAKEVKLYLYDCPAPRPFPETLPIMETFKQQACACSDHACTEKVMADLEKWRTGLADAITYDDTGDAAGLEAGKKFRALDQEIERCKR